LSLSAALTARADEYHWIGSTSGTWDANFTDNWYNDTTGTTSGTLPGINNAWYPTLTSATTGTDYITIGSGNDLFFNVNKYNIKGLKVESSATLTFNSGDRFGFNEYLQNAGVLILKTSGQKVLSQVTSTVMPLNITNTGTIIASGPGAVWILSISGTNTGGLLRAENGGSLNMAFSKDIWGGAISIGVSSTFTHDNVQTNGQGTLVLHDVAFDSAGHFDWQQTNGAHNKSITFTGGGFTNSGSVTFAASGSHGGANPRSWVDLQLAGDLTATNSGFMSFRNTDGTNYEINTATANLDEYVRLVVNLSGDGSFVNSGHIEVYNNTIGTVGANRAQYAALTVNDGAKFTNTGTISVSLGTDTLDDAQHYATLLINTDWTNTGVITVDGADKTLAEARIDLGTKIYTQTGADSVTRLAHGGQLKAAAVTISDGTLAGAGEVLAATTVSTGGILDPDGTLTLNSLTLSAGSILNFSFADNDLLDITGNLTLRGATLNLTDSEVATGTYTIASYDTLSDNYTLSVSGLSGDYNYELDFLTNSQVNLIITIPEPSTWALLLTSAMTLLLALHRRR
jgi:hypothetical protein